MQFENHIFVVSGAASGIGHALVIELLQRGAIVAAVDVKEITFDSLSEVALTKLTRHFCDVSSLEQVKTCAAEILQTHGYIDGLLNIAGIAQPFVDFKTMDVQYMKHIMDVNYFGTMYMIKTFLPTLLTRPHAHILNVSSTGGLVSVPGQSIYGASKAAIKLLSECLHVELQDTNIKVTLAIPGSIDTGIMQFNEEINERTRKVLAQREKVKMMSAQQCAMILCDAIIQSKFQVLIGKDAQIINALMRIMPQKTRAMMAKMIK